MSHPSLKQTSWSEVLEKAIVIQLVKKLPAFYFITIVNKSLSNHLSVQ